jgi:hypothetical protein
MCRPIQYPEDFCRAVLEYLPHDPKIADDLAVGAGYCVRQKLIGSNLIDWWEKIFKGRPKTSLEAYFGM